MSQEIVVRILVESAKLPSGDVALHVQAQGGLPMQAASTPAPANCYKLLEKYLDWGRIQGGKKGGPWDPIHAQQARTRLTWWLERLHIGALEELTLPIVEELVPKVPGKKLRGRVFPASGKTKKDYLSMLLAFRTWASDRDLVKIPQPDPLRALRKPDGEPETEYRALSVEEFQALLAVAPPLRREVYAALALTGLRRAELRRARVSWLDTSRHCLVLPANETKNRKRSQVPLAPGLFELLRKRAEGRKPDEYLYKYSVTQLSKDFRIDCDKAQIPYETPEGRAALHGMRDTASTLLQQALGYDLATASAFLRHSGESITRRRYTSVAFSRRAGAAEALENLLTPAAHRDAAVNNRVSAQGSPEVQAAGRVAGIKLASPQGFEPWSSG